MIGVTGARRASRMKVGRTPPSLPKTKLGRKITCSSPDSLTARSISHFAAKYGTASFVRSSRPSALASTKRRTPASCAAATTFHVPSDITRSKSPGRPPGAPRGETSGVRGLAHERAHRRLLRPERVHDVRADEPGPAGDENGHESSPKFCQYRLAVGPRWPLYFEPMEAEPYGVTAGSVICMKETCPIFMPG